MANSFLLKNLKCFVKCVEFSEKILVTAGFKCGSLSQPSAVISESLQVELKCMICMTFLPEILNSDENYYIFEHFVHEVLHHVPSTKSTLQHAIPHL